MAGRPENALSLVRLMTDFYRRVVESPRLAHFFAEVSMDSLIAHQAAFIATVKDATPRYSDEQIVEAHSGLNITDDDFDEMLRLLRATLLDHQMPEADIDVIMNEFSKRRPIVVIGKPAGGT